jgi:hypothetical protein
MSFHVVLGNERRVSTMMDLRKWIEQYLYAGQQNNS